MAGSVLSGIPVKMSAVQPVSPHAGRVGLAFPARETKKKGEKNMVKAFHQLWDLVFYFCPGKVEMVCTLFCIRFPQQVNNSHKQRLSHSPTYLTCIQCSDSLHVMRYFSHQIEDMISGNP